MIVRIRGDPFPKYKKWSEGKISRDQKVKGAFTIFKKVMKKENKKWILVFCLK